MKKLKLTLLFVVVSFFSFGQNLSIEYDRKTESGTITKDFGFDELWQVIEEEKHSWQITKLTEGKKKFMHYGEIDYLKIIINHPEYGLKEFVIFKNKEKTYWYWYFIGAVEVGDLSALNIDIN